MLQEEIEEREKRLEELNRRRADGGKWDGGEGKSKGRASEEILDLTSK